MQPARLPQAIVLCSRTWEDAAQAMAKPSGNPPPRQADAWRRPRLHANAQLAAGKVHALGPDEASYLTAVLRLKPGSEIYLFDGHGSEHRCRLAKEGRTWLCEIGDPIHFASADPKLQIHVGQGAGSRNRLDWAVEKMTEVGVWSLTPLATFGTARRDQVPDQAARWERLAKAACSQCGRNVVPAIGNASDVASWSRELPPGCAKFLLSMDAQAPLLSTAAAQAAGADSVGIVVGRLAGLDASEERACIELGFRPASLGSRVLRVETAGIAAIAILLAAAGEM